jgi:hypothetical protein
MLMISSQSLCFVKVKKQDKPLKALRLAVWLLFSYLSTWDGNLSRAARTENQGNSGSGGIAAKKSQWDCLFRRGRLRPRRRKPPGALLPSPFC